MELIPAHSVSRTSCRRVIAVLKSGVGNSNTSYQAAAPAFARCACAHMGAPLAEPRPAIGCASSGQSLARVDSEAGNPLEAQPPCTPTPPPPPRRPWLPPAPDVPTPRATHNAAMLAYLGDSIYELYARWHFLHPPVAIPGYCQRVMSVVRCEAQDLLLQRLQKRKPGFLSPSEQDVLRWGRNASTGARKAKGRAGRAVYGNATALETLIGFLYLTDVGRLHELMLALGFTCNSQDHMVPEELYIKG